MYNLIRVKYEDKLALLVVFSIYIRLYKYNIYNIIKVC